MKRVPWCMMLACALCLVGEFSPASARPAGKLTEVRGKVFLRRRGNAEMAVGRLQQFDSGDLLRLDGHAGADVLFYTGKARYELRGPCLVQLLPSGIQWRSGNRPVPLHPMDAPLQTARLEGGEGGRYPGTFIHYLPTGAGQYRCHWPVGGVRSCPTSLRWTHVLALSAASGKAIQARYVVILRADGSALWRSPLEPGGTTIGLPPRLLQHGHTYLWLLMPTEDETEALCAARFTVLPSRGAGH